MNTNHAEVWQGTITNNGTFMMNDQNLGTDLNMSGDVILKGTGTVNLSNDAGNRIMAYGQTAPGASLTNQSTIQGAGQFGFTNGIGTGNSVINQGTIFANQRTALFINVNSGTFTNTGTVKVKAGNLLYIGGPGSTNFSGATYAGDRECVHDPDDERADGDVGDSGGLSINSGEHFEIAYNATNVTLTVVSGP